MFIIFVFATLCIFGSMIVRDNTVLGSVLEYTIGFENRFYDFRSRSIIDTEFKSQEQVLVKIDDYSLKKIGVWPIPRKNYALMLDKLDRFGAKVVALDVLFPEKSNPVDDKAFEDSIRRFQDHEGKRVFLAYTVTPDLREDMKDPNIRVNIKNDFFESVILEAPLEMLNDVLQTRTVPEKDINPYLIQKFTFPIESIVATEVGLGTINNHEDHDGVFRHYHLISNIDTIYYGSLALNSFDALRGEKKTITISENSTGELALGKKKLEISERGESKIRYIGSDEQFNEVSLYDLINAKDDDQQLKSLFKDKLVFVGSTALGAHDLRPSPVNQKMPGVYSHMNMAHMLLTEYLYQDNEISVKYSLFYLFLGMSLFIFVVRFGNAFFDAAIVGIIIGASYYLDRYYFLPNGYELKLFYCYFCFIACYSWHTFIEFYRASKEKKQIRGTFARYVSPTVVDEMLKDPDHIQVGGSKMDITCLFSDVRDFTSISEGMSAVELAHSLNMYMGQMTDIVFETKGTLDKYIGDAIVALWGAPLPIGNHAQFAVEGAIRMMEILPAINDEFKRLGRPEFNIGIGLNSGECSVGNMGSSRIFSYTALGDNMNLGARLEGLCKYYGAQILISEYTLARLDKEKIKTRPIDKAIVKGKTHPVQIFEVLHTHHVLTKKPELYALYLEAYELFLRKNFSEAILKINAVLKDAVTDKPSERLRDACQKFYDHPELVTEDFDVTKMTEK